MERSGGTQEGVKARPRETRILNCNINGDPSPQTAICRKSVAGGWPFGCFRSGSVLEPSTE